MSGPIVDWMKSLFTISNLLKLVAALVASYGATYAPTVVPAMSSKAGANPTEFLNMVLPMVVAAVTWFASTYFKVKPELIQAVTAVIANPKDPLADLKLASAVFVYIQEQWPEAPEAVRLIGEGVKKLTDAVGADLTKPVTPAA